MCKKSIFTDVLTISSNLTFSAVKLHLYQDWNCHLCFILELDNSASLWTLFPCSVFGSWAFIILCLLYRWACCIQVYEYFYLVHIFSVYTSYIYKPTNLKINAVFIDMFILLAACRSSMYKEIHQFLGLNPINQQITVSG